MREEAKLLLLGEENLALTIAHLKRNKKVELWPGFWHMICPNELPIVTTISQAAKSDLASNQLADVDLIGMATA